MLRLMALALLNQPKKSNSKNQKSRNILEAAFSKYPLEDVSYTFKFIYIRVRINKTKSIRKYFQV